MLKGTRNVLANECLEDEDRQVEDAVLDDSPASLQTCTNTYVAGYLANSVLNKFKCNYCADVLLKCLEEPLEENEAFIFAKDFNITHIKYLKRPSNEFNAFISILIKNFPTFYENYKLGNRVTVSIQKECITIMKDFRNLTCETHLHYLISLFIKIMINRFHKNIIQKLHYNNSKNKLRILSSQ
jgi:hypothetical protein